MDKKAITIITGTGGPFGTGHFQRMCTLADHLVRVHEIPARIVIASGRPDIPEQLQELITDTIPDDASLIIRDMRDSTMEEMNTLKERAPVLAIDDTGPGRLAADHVLDLLPSPLSKHGTTGMFIYGYNFIRSIYSMKHTPMKKDIDVAIYAGNPPDEKIAAMLMDCMPKDISVVLFTGGEARLLSRGVIAPLNGYVQVLLRSRILLTHFGITLFEGDLAGCRIIAVNPSSYHTELTFMIAEQYDVIPAGEYSAMDRQKITSEVQKITGDPQLKIISAGSIRERINISLEYFTRYLNNIMSGGSDAGL